MISNKELKRRYEDGEITRKDLKIRLTKEFKRVCSYKECDNMLAFMSKRAKFCSASHASKEKVRLKAMNRKKKKAYYERHGIKFNKTIRKRNAEAGPTGVNYSGQTLLYENYKEPLKPIEKGKGYGFYGTVALTDDKEYIQCHICGNLYGNLGLHLRKHKIIARDYKEKFGLAVGTALVSEPVREALQQRAVKRFDGKLPDHLVEYNRKVQSGQVKHNASHKRSLEWRNKQGLCPDQVLDKIREYAKELGRTPSQDEFAKHYKGRYIGSITFQHGSWLNAVKKLDMISAKEEKEYTNEELIERLQQFQEEHGRIPMTSDFNRGLLPSRNTYFHRFGTLNNARVEAGLNAVLPMPFGQVMELTPEEYIKYKSGYEVPGKVSQKIVRRRIVKKLRRHKKKAMV